MAKLQTIQRDPRIPKEVFLEVRTIIQLLGSSSDIFKPQIEEQLMNQNKKFGLDGETEQWIVDLVNGDIGGGGRRKTLTDEGASVTQSSASGSGNGASVSGGTEQSLFAMAQASLAAKNSGLSAPVQSSEEKQFSAMLEETENWNFDVFDVHRATNGRPLLFLGMALFQKYDLVAKFKIDTQKLKKFLTVIER